MTYHIFQPPDGESKNHRYHSCVESFLNSFFFRKKKPLNTQIIACLILILTTIIALIWNSTTALEHNYQHILSLKIGVHFSHLTLDNDIKTWVNGLLLTLFFFFLGLEIKREVLVGDLMDRNCLLFVVCAALGGMLIPALIFYTFNYHTIYQHGWSIPLSTDTAFVLGILACFRKKLPSGAFTFIAGIAIIDDLITLSIIALFYSHSIHPDYLIIAAFLFSLSIFFNYCGIRKPFIYLLIGLATWYVISLAGIHGSIAGILIALTVPARPKRGPRYAIQRIQKLVYSFEIREKQEPLIFSDQQQHYILEDLQTTAKYSTTPLQHWRSLLEPFIAFFVLPLFIFCNAGIHINIHLIAEALSHWMSLSIFLSLIFGKFIGVTLFSKLSLLLKLGKLPKDTSFNHIMILAIISGVGFTTAIFTSVLSFSDGSHELALAKISILLASIICTITGITLLSITKGKNGGCNHEKFTPKSHSLSRHLLSRIWLY